MTDQSGFPKITIITACLNARRTIEQTLRSVLDQNYPNLEYIIVDGGSTDGTLEIVEKYRDKLALVISEPDRGIYDAFNKGIRHAAGDVIGILNADDFYAPWALERIAGAYAASPESDVFFGKVVVIDAEGKKWRVYSAGSPECLVDRMSVSHPAVFAPKRTYETRGFFDEHYRIAGDWDYMLGLYMSGASFCAVNYVLTAFRFSGVSSSLSRRHMSENRRVYLKHIDKNAAIKKIIKMYIKYYGRLLLKLSGTYDFYAAYRDKCLIVPEVSGEYGLGGAESMWENIRACLDSR